MEFPDVVPEAYMCHLERKSKDKSVPEKTINWIAKSWCISTLLGSLRDGAWEKSRDYINMCKLMDKDYKSVIMIFRLEKYIYKHTR